MDHLLFDEYAELPNGFLASTPEELHRHLPRPAIIRLPGPASTGGRGGADAAWQ
jgi:hypothetical protein